MDEVMRLVEQYRSRYVGWTVKHFYSKYRQHKGQRSYNFVRLALQREGVVTKAKRPGAHRRRRERKPLIGMMLHQDGSRHEWLAGQQHDLIVTLDDAMGAIYAAFLVAEEDTMSSFFGVVEVIARHGLVNTTCVPSQAALAYPADSPTSLRFGQGPFHDAPTPVAVRRLLADGVVEIVDTPDGERMQFTVARALWNLTQIVEIDRGNGRGETLALAALADDRSRCRSARAPQGPHGFDARLRLRTAG